MLWMDYCYNSSRHAAALPCRVGTTTTSDELDLNHFLKIELDNYTSLCRKSSKVVPEVNSKKNEILQIIL
jgi:hypothetical protein